MPIWRLTPINLQDPEWQASLYKGEVFVRAADADQARQTAAVALRTQVDVRRVQDTSWTTPWTQAHLVTCMREEGSIYQDDGPDAVLWPQAEGLGVPPEE